MQGHGLRLLVPGIPYLIILSQCAGSSVKYRSEQFSYMDGKLVSTMPYVQGLTNDLCLPQISLDESSRIYRLYCLMYQLM